MVRYSAIAVAVVLAGFSICPGRVWSQKVISIPALDGGFVVADLYGEGQRGVVLAHGGRFDRSSWTAQAQTLAEVGFRVLAIDFRAAVDMRAGRDSACLYDEACLAKDVLAAVRYLHETGAAEVCVVGASLGGGAAAQATVEARDGEIECVVLLAHMLIETPERMKGRKLFVVMDGDLRADQTPRLSGIREQYEKAPSPKELLILEGEAHAQFIFATPGGDRVMEEIVGFLSAP